MNRIKVLSSITFIILFVSFALICLTPNNFIARAETKESNTEQAVAQANTDTAEPYALFVDVVLSLDGANGEVWSIAQTRVAIFATSIQVVLELYSSDTYQDSYTNMTLEKRVSTTNLKKGETIKAVMPTNGVQKYWKGRMYYKADSADWKYGVTDTLLLDANGIIVL